MSEEEPEQAPELTCEAYRITVDDGRESFYAASLEEPGNEAAWLMSDTVYSLETWR